MTHFIGGPAEGKADGLCFNRAPYFLRLTYEDGRGGTKATGKWDCLNELSDHARPHESLYCYRQVSNRGHVHICRSREHGGGGYFVQATYEFVESQPDDATMRDNERWTEWVHNRWDDLPEDQKQRFVMPKEGAKE